MTERFNVFECEVTELRRHLRKVEQLLDFRQYLKFAGGRVTGDERIQLGSIQQLRDEADLGQPIFVLRRSGKGGAEALKKLLSLGFTGLTRETTTQEA